VRLKHLWEEHLCGPWTESKLLSRKFLMVVVFAAAAFGLDVAGWGLGDSTLNFLRDIIIAFIGVQGAIDFFRYRAMSKEKGGKNDEKPLD
jgi:hypothetical protein